MELDNSLRGEVSIGQESIARIHETVMKLGESARDKANLKTEDTAETTQRKQFGRYVLVTCESSEQLKKKLRLSLSGAKLWFLRLVPA